MPITLSRLVPKGTMLPLASSASVFGCSEMVVGVRCERVYKRVLQARLMGDLILEACRRPRRVVDGRMSEGVVQDQRPAGGTFVVLPQPGRQPVEIQEPRGLLVATKRSLVQFREKLGIGIHYGHFWTLVPVVEATVLNNVRKSFDSGLDLGGRWSFRTKYEALVAS